jgi:hypothetical protein
MRELHGRIVTEIATAIAAAIATAMDRGASFRRSLFTGGRCG